MSTKTNKPAKSVETISNKADKLAQGLETTPTATETSSDKNQENYSDVEWLKTNNPTHTTENTSSKFDAEREAIILGIALPTVEKLFGEQINPLVILLAKWWEVKPARLAIKKLIDKEATGKSIAPDVYLQEDLRKPISVLKTVGMAADRLSYAINYFKPRAGVGQKDFIKLLAIDGVTYQISNKLFVSAASKMTKDELRAYVMENGVTPTNLEEM